MLSVLPAARVCCHGGSYCNLGGAWHHREDLIWRWLACHPRWRTAPLDVPGQSLILQSCVLPYAVSDRTAWRQLTVPVHA